MSSRSNSAKLNSFLERYGFVDKIVSGGAVIRLLSSKCGIDFDFDPQDNLHFVGIFDPSTSSGSNVNYYVNQLPEEARQMVKLQRSVLDQWEVYVDILEINFKNILEGDFS